MVGGALDPSVTFMDNFVARAQEQGCPIDYLRIPDMDHYIRERPEIIEASFEWFSKQVKS